MTLIDERTKVFSDIGIGFQREVILKTPPFTNWFKNEESKERLDKILGRTMKDVKSYIKPRAVLRVLRREETDIAAYAPPEELLKSEFLAVGVVTIGEKTSGKLNADRLYESLVIDALENVALIEAERKVVMHLKEIADREGLKTTRTIPPGSGRINWSTENQEFIFKNLGAWRIGVVLNSSFVMLPKKSVSFVMGMGHDIEQAKDLFSCAGCKRLDCPYRV
ncbi:MAG: hypothetical protein ABH852_04140 [Methanobacteriota archaeon]